MAMTVREMQQFMARSSALEPSSANVIDTARRNAWGEPWVEIALITPDQARRCAASLNAGHAAWAWLADDPIDPHK